MTVRKDYHPPPSAYSLDTRMPDAVPNDPLRELAAYEQTPHYRDRIDCDRRPIDHVHADKAIIDGSVEPNPNAVDHANSWRFRDELAGMQPVVVVGSDRDPDRRRLIRITAFVDVADYDRAVSADAWSRSDVNAAALLQYLAGNLNDDVVHAKTIDVRKPVPLHGHRVICKDGYYRAYCVDCRLRSGQRITFDKTPCR